MNSVEVHLPMALRNTVYCSMSVYCSSTVYVSILHAQISSVSSAQFSVYSSTEYTAWLHTLHSPVSSSSSRRTGNCILLLYTVLLYILWLMHSSNHGSQTSLLVYRAAWVQQLTSAWVQCSVYTVVQYSVVCSAAPSWRRRWVLPMQYMQSCSTSIHCTTVYTALLWADELLSAAACWHRWSLHCIHHTGILVKALTHVLDVLLYPRRSSWTHVSAILEISYIHSIGDE